MAVTVVRRTKTEGAAARVSPPPDMRKSAMPWLYNTVIILGVVAGQIVFIYLLMPERFHWQTSQQRESGQDDFAEVSVGEFSCSNTIAVRNVMTRVEFKLALLASSNQAATLESQVDRNQNRIHEAVNKVVRSSTLEELYDPELATIKRLVRGEVNELLGKRLVVDVMIDGVRVVEQ